MNHEWRRASRFALGGLVLALAVACAPGGGGSAAPAAGPAAKPVGTAGSSNVVVQEGGGTPTVVAAPAAPAAASAPAAQPAALQKVRYGDLNLLSDAGVYVAIDEGYFAEQGIELDLLTFDSAANMVAPLATSQLEVGGGATSAGLFNALRSGVNVRIVADKGHSDPTPPGFPVSIYFVRKELAESGRVRGIADLKGLRYSQPARGISPEVDIVALLKEGGLSLSDLDGTVMSFPDLVPAFANGNLDFAWAPEPFATIMINQGTVVPIKYDYEVNPYHQVAVLLYSPEFSRSDVGTRFMAAYLKGVRLYNDAFLKRLPAAREKVVDALVKHTPVKNRALYDQMTLAALHPDGQMNLESFDRQQEWFLSTGTQQGRIDLSQYIDLQHIQAASAQLGPYR
jgi:NitT/TauT family transport system substrate-binding protein